MKKDLLKSIEESIHKDPALNFLYEILYTCYEKAIPIQYLKENGVYTPVYDGSFQRLVHHITTEITHKIEDIENDTKEDYKKNLNERDN